VQIDGAEVGGANWRRKSTERRSEERFRGTNRWSGGLGNESVARRWMLWPWTWSRRGRERLDGEVRRRDSGTAVVLFSSPLTVSPVFPTSL
jgi:hypothetical protein